MTEEATTTETTTETTAETTAAATTTTVPASFIGDDGTFTEGWQEKYLTEDQRANARVTGGRVKSVQGMMDTIINSDKMISGDKMLRPSDSFGDADWDEYHKAGGWTGEDTVIERPEGLPEEYWNEDTVKTYSAKMNELRLTPKQVAGLVEMRMLEETTTLTNKANTAENDRAELKAGLLADWGNAYTQKEAVANFAVEKGANGDAEFEQRILKKFGSDPDFIRFSANLGAGFSEAGNGPVIKQALTPADVQTKINELYKSEAFNKPNHPEHKQAMATLARLHEQKASVRTPA
jgi:hypothetical protein